MHCPTITLSFDDALDSHLDEVVPLLDRFGLKGTFFVHISSECLARRSEEWRKAAANGHELGNHSLLHPAVGCKDWVRAGNALEDYTLDRMRMELEVANNVLRTLDGRTERTFAYPCDNSVLGRSGVLTRCLESVGLGRSRPTRWVDRWRLDFGSRRVDYSSVVRELFYAARLGGLAKGLPVLPTDRHRIPAVSGDGCAAQELHGWVDKAIEAEAWTVFCFHGIGGGHGLFCEQSAFEEFVKRLAADRRVVVKTFLEAAKGIWG